MKRRGRGRGKSKADSLLSREPDTGLDPRPPDSQDHDPS